MSAEMIEFTLSKQWRCATCQHCQRTQAPSLVDCAENPDAGYEPAIHVDDAPGCDLYREKA